MYIGGIHIIKYICFSAINVLLQGSLSQKLRGVEGILFFLPYTVMQPNRDIVFFGFYE